MVTKHCNDAVDGNSVVDLLSHDDDDDDDVDLLSHPLQCDFLLGRRPTKYKSFTEIKALLKYQIAIESQTMKGI